mgnify:CR=1 FL=1
MGAGHNMATGFDNDQDPNGHPDIHGHHDEAAGVKSRKMIWKVFWILLALTVIEFVIAFTIGRGTFRNVTFILMTLVKAFYIVAYFMHLKDEIKSLIVTIIVPLVFVCWLILALLIEGSFINGGWFPG